MEVEIISGEKIQMLCDVYIGKRSVVENPKIDKSKYVQLSRLDSNWDNPKRIFCYADTLAQFMTKLHVLTNPFILISHNGDTNITHEFLPIIQHPLLISWFAQNVMITHPCSKLHMLPIGVANEMWAHGNLHALRDAQRQMNVKEDRIYFYFNIDTNPTQREECKQIVSSKGLCFGTNQTHSEYLNALAKCKFAICPPGNGVDSHRIWECYYLDVIPIVLESTFTLLVSNNLPCIVLKSWDEFDPCDAFHRYNSMIESLRIHQKFVDFAHYKLLIQGSS
jgi:hypothetical protein